MIMANNTDENNTFAEEKNENGSRKQRTMQHDKYIKFDWVAKYMLRDKENHGVLAGFLSVLLNGDVQIDEVVDSESNKVAREDKINRVDVKAKNAKGEIILVEIQVTRQWDYLERILFGAAKAITEHIKSGEEYRNVKKVYSISILYFDLGIGNDYVYHGQTVFRGVNTGDELQISSKERDVIRMRTPEEVFPEYYLIRVNAFDKEAVTPLEEWLDYLKNEHIKDDTKTPGLSEAREKLQYLKMTPEEREEYDAHLECMAFEKSVLKTEHMAGEYKGKEEGIKEGTISERKRIAKELKLLRVPTEMIIQSSGLTKKEIEEL